MSCSLKIREEIEQPERCHRATCSLCLVQFARYTCPRCNVQYCSLDCYKSEKHAECSEKFYQECFMSELQSQTTSSAERDRMIEILRRVGKESVEEEDGGIEDHHDETLDERLAGLDLDTEDPDRLWERLTRSEKKQFQKALSSGHLGSLLTVHTPWWKLMKPVVIKEKTDSHCPLDILPNLPPFHSLVKGGKVSPLIRYSILNVLYAYAYTVRLYNGDHHNLAVEAAQTVLDISSCLSDNASYCMAGEALSHAVATVQQTKNICSNGEMSLSVMKDVSCILCSPLSYCSAPHALSDLHHILTSAITQLHSQSGLKRECKSVRLACKKVYFLTAWASQNVPEIKCLASIVDIEHETSVTSWKSTKAIHTMYPEQKPPNSKLITELS